MKPFFKRSMTTAVLTLLYAVPSTLFAGDGNIAITMNPMPVSLGGIVTITAIGSEFEDKLVYGEVDIKNADDDKILDCQS